MPVVVGDPMVFVFPIDHRPPTPSTSLEKGRSAFFPGLKYHQEVRSGFSSCLMWVRKLFDTNIAPSVSDLHSQSARITPQPPHHAEETTRSVPARVSEDGHLHQRRKCIVQWQIVGVNIYFIDLGRFVPISLYNSCFPRWFGVSQQHSGKHSTKWDTATSQLIMDRHNPYLTCLMVIISNSLLPFLLGMRIVAGCADYSWWFLG